MRCIPVLFVWLFSASLFAQKGPFLPPDPAIRHGVLSNGMQYFLRPNAKPQQRAELWLAVKAGSLQEEEDQQGLAHFVEHMAFNGTRHFPKNELIHYLEKTGVRFGPDLNAYTSFEETVYMIQARTDSLAFLETGLLILEDWCHGLLFDEEETEKERGVVLSEWRTGLSPEQRLQDRYFPFLYAGSRYAERLPIGDPAILQAAPVGRLRDFYRDWYRPDLMAIVAVGDFDPEWMEIQIKERFETWGSANDSKPRKEYTAPITPGLRTAVYTDPEVSLTQLRFSIKLPGVPLHSEAGFRKNLLARLFNGMLNERLLELQQGAAPPFTFASSGYYGSDLGGNHVYYLSVTAGEERITDGLQAVLGATLQAVQQGFSENTLQRQKAEALRGARQAAAEAASTNSDIWANKLLDAFLRNHPMPSPAEMLEQTRITLETITLNDILQEARDWLKTPEGVLILTAPEKVAQKLPDSAYLRRIVQELWQTRWPTFEEMDNEGPLLSHALSPIPLANKTYFDSIQVTELTFLGGLRVVVKPTDYKQEEVLLTAFSPGGHSLYADSLYFSAIHATPAMDQSGIGDLSYPALMKKLAGKTLSLSPYIAELEEGFNGRCAPDELETLLQLIYLYGSSPRFDSVALASYLQRQEALYRNMMLNPYYVFGEEKERIKYQQHLRKGIPKAENLQHVRLEQIRNVFQDRFADFSDFTFVLVGDVQPDSIEYLLRKYLGNLPAKGRTETSADIGARLAAGVLDTILYGGTAPKALQEITFHGVFDYTAEQRYAFTSLLSVVRLRLREVLREDAGGVYGVNVYGAPARLPKPEFKITLAFNAVPEAVDSLTRLVFETLEHLKRKGPTEDELEKVRSSQWQSRLKSERENSFWLNQLAARYREGIGLQGLAPDAYRKRLDTLSADMMRQAAIRYFPLDSCISIRLMPLPTISEPKPE